MNVLASNKEVLNDLNEMAMAYLPAVDLDADLELFSQSYYAFSKALLNFGEAELNFRTGERYNVLSLSSDVVNYSNQQLQQWNERGTVILNRAIDAINEFIDTQSLESTGVPAARFADMQVRTKLFLAQTHLKPSDVVKVSNALNQMVDKAVAGGELAVVTFMRDKMIELRDIRRTPSRGTEENIPIWKLIGIIILFGLPVFKVLRCLIRNRCCRTVDDVEALVAFIAAVAVLLC